MFQSSFRNGWHDSLQYHAFCDDKVFAVRVFWTGSLWHHSAWVYDGEVRELHNSAEPLTQSDAPHTDLRGSDFELAAPDEAVSIRVGSELSLILVPGHTMYGPSPFGPGLHHPDMRATVTYLGDSLPGLAYCKRYDFREGPFRHWGYRFVHGTILDHRWSLWTADATFDFTKHAYFRTIDATGVIREAGASESCHRDDHCYGVIEGSHYDVELEELGVWDTLLRSPEMDTQMRQRCCRMTVHHDGQSESGYAINELCLGTLG